MAETLFPIIPERSAPRTELLAQLELAEWTCAAIQQVRQSLPVDGQTGVVLRSPLENRLINEQNAATGIHRVLSERAAEITEI